MTFNRRPCLLLLLPALLTALPSAALAKKVLFISDPQSSTKQVTLLEHAIVETLRRIGGHTVERVDGTRADKAAVRALDQVEGLRNAAKADFEQLELDTALKKYTKALNKVEKAVVGADSIQPLTDTLLMAAATCLLLGQERKARTFLERLVLLEPEVAPDEAVFNPQMMAVFEAVASRARAAAEFDVEVTVDPPGAAVLFDGRLVGVAPVTVTEVRQGKHYVTASLKGFETRGIVADIKATGDHSVDLKLIESPADSKLQVQASAAVAAIEDEELSPEAADLASGHKAEVVTILAVRSGNFRLVRFAASGGNRVSRTTPTDITDVESAKRAARRLLGSLAGGTDEAAQGADAIAARTLPASSAGGAKEPRGSAAAGAPEEITAAPAETAAATATPTAAGGGGVLSANGTKDTALWLTYGGAAALAAAGGVFGVLALTAQNEYVLEGRIADGPDAGKFDQDLTTDQIEGDAIAKAGRRNALIADIFYGVAAAALITGVCLHILWDAPPDAGTSGSGTESGSSGDGWGLTIGPGSLRLRF